jgi:hypothetical protein
MLPSLIIGQEDLMRSASFRLLATAIVVVMSLVGAQAASAKAGPSVSWTSPPSASAGNPISVSWTSKNLPQGAKLVVQRSVGTAHVWKTALKLSKPSGTVQLPARSLGTYRYRLVALEGESIIAKRTVTLDVFGKVLFSKYFGQQGGVYAAPTVSFSYSNYLYGPTTPNMTEAVVSVKKSNCNSVHVEFITGSNFPGPGAEPTVGTMTVVQQTRDPVSSSAPWDTVGTVDAELVLGQSWSVLASWANGAHLPDIYYNGYVVCDSTKPF